MYFRVYSDKPSPDRFKCLELPPTFSKDSLLLDIEFTYNGHKYVQHQAIVTFEQCVSGFVYELYGYLHGYMTPDERKCVYECTGIYAPGDEENMICSCASHLAPNGKTCVAECDDD